MTISCTCKKSFNGGTRDREGGRGDKMKDLPWVNKSYTRFVWELAQHCSLLCTAGYHILIYILSEQSLFAWSSLLTLKVLVTTIDALGRTLWKRIITAQCEGMGEVGSARYEPALLPPCPSIRLLSYNNCQRPSHNFQKFSTLRVKVLSRWACE